MSIRIPKILKNKYALTLLIFFIWLLTFESTNFFRLIEYRKTLVNFEEEIALYQSKIEETKLDIEELRDPILLEKFAREEYFMKKENEIIFVYHPSN